MAENTKPGEASKQDIVVQDSTGRFYRIDAERLAEFAMSDDEVEKFLCQVGEGGMVVGSQPSAPVPGAAVRMVPGAGVRWVPGAAVRMVPGAGVRWVPGAAVRMVPGAAVRMVPGAGVRWVPGAAVRMVPGAGVRWVPSAAVRMAPGAMPGKTVVLRSWAIRK